MNAPIGQRVHILYICHMFIITVNLRRKCVRDGQNIGGIKCALSFVFLINIIYIKFYTTLMCYIGQ